jgi:hypothetical protein
MQFDRFKRRAFMLGRAVSWPLAARATMSDSSAVNPPKTKN